MSRKYNIKILSDGFEVSVAGDPIKSLIISGTSEIYTYSASEIFAVTIKTMDTGPSVEDMYAEIYTDDTIYIILSESSIFKNTVLDTLNSIVPINLELFIEASMYHFNKTFVLYKKEGSNVDTDDNDEKKIAILEASILTLHKIKQSEGLSGFIFALMSFCPMYLLYGKGEHKDQLVNLSAIKENMVPVFTSLEKCPKLEQFEAKKVSADTYTKLLVSGKCDVAVNFNTDCQIIINSQQLQGILLPLVMLREDPACKENALGGTPVSKNSQPAKSENSGSKKKSFFDLFKRKKVNTNQTEATKQTPKDSHQSGANTPNSKADILNMIMREMAQKTPSDHFASGAIFDITRQRHNDFSNIVMSNNAATLKDFFAKAYIDFCNQPQLVGFSPDMVDKNKNDTNPAMWNADIVSLPSGEKVALCFMPINNNTYAARIIGVVLGNGEDRYYYCMLNKDENTFSEVIRNKAMQGVEKIGEVKRLGFELMNSFVECIKNN